MTKTFEVTPRIEGLPVGTKYYINPLNVVLVRPVPILGDAGVEEVVTEILFLNTTGAQSSLKVVETVRWVVDALNDGLGRV